MKKVFSLLASCFVTTLALNSAVEARDLTYRMGVGFAQQSMSFVSSGLNTGTRSQLSGVHASYGLAADMQAGIFFGFQDNFDIAAMGPTFRYDLQRLLSRDSSIWNHLNIFSQVSFLVKFGSEIEKGVTLHLPFIGFEILPFEKNNFAISTSMGLMIDLMDETNISFNQAQFGDLSVRYYF
jgi:hypothetical protein